MRMQVQAEGEAEWDASGAHVRKRERLKKRGSRKREAHVHRCPRAPCFSSHQVPTQSAHQIHRVNGLCGVSGVGVASNAPCRARPRHGTSAIDARDRVC